MPTPPDPARAARIYAFCNSCSEGWHGAMAMCEDGHVLAQHVCSSHGFIAHDLGVVGTWKHEEYAAHCPDGFTVEMVDDPRTHAGVQAAYKLNQAMGDASRRPSAKEGG